MPMHLVAFHATRSAAASLSALNPVADPTVRIEGQDLYVPDKYNQVIAATGLVTAGTLDRLQLQAPSLREFIFPEISPGVVGANFGYPDQIERLFADPLQLVTNEALQFWSDANDGATSTECYGLVWLADGKPSVQNGKIFSIHATGAAVETLSTWVNTPLTFDQTLPVGKYDIVGMRAMSATLIAARLNFIGASAVTRPGVPGNPNNNVQGQVEFRMGNAGLFGTFDSTTPPSVDVLGSGGTAVQEFILDLIQRG